MRSLHYNLKTLRPNIWKKDMPNPTDVELDSKLFNALWSVMKDWDINVPEYYNGYCSCNGSHLKLILDAIVPVIREDKIDDIIS